MWAIEKKNIIGEWFQSVGIYKTKEAAEASLKEQAARGFKVDMTKTRIVPTTPYFS